MKFCIIGPAGSGKTTLAKQINNITNYSHTDLDNLFWNNNIESYGIKRDTLSRIKIHG